MDLPEEIIELILLSKCPAKSVIRFKSVSKSWQSIISNPRFLRSLQSKLWENHEHKFISFPHGKCRRAYDGKERAFDVNLMIVKDGKCRRDLAAFEYPTPDEWPVLLFSCNGLILFLLVKDYDDEYKLWNPLTRKHINISPPPLASPSDHITSRFKMGHHLYHDPITDDYKIVTVSEDCNYAVYSCRNGSWGEPKDFSSKLNWINAFVDGCAYTMQSGTGVIICFDTRDGKLHELPRPKEVEGLLRLRLEAVSGQLCLYGFRDDGKDDRLLQMWVMEKKKKQYCWSWNWRKLISMEKEEPCIGDLHPVCLTNEDDVVVLCGFRDVNGGYYPKHLIYRNSSFNVQDLIGSWDHFRPIYFPYSENLLMPPTSTSNTPS